MRSHIVLLGVGAVLLAGGCGRTEERAASERMPAQESAARPMQPQVVEVRTVDYAFQMPDSVPAGLTTIRLFNVGPDLHHLMLYRLEQGHTLDELLALLRQQKPMPEWAVAVGGPNAPAPGASSNATLRLEPGQYAAICVIPAADGVPHVMKGMAHAFRVTPAREPEMPNPRSDVTVTLGEYSFEIAPALTAGQHTVRVVNAGTQPHEMFILKLAPGKTPQDLVTWVEHRNGPPPGEPMGGVTAIQPGGTNYFTMSFTPGRYGLYCFLPDVRDGKTHIEHGMIREIDIP